VGVSITLGKIVFAVILVPLVSSAMALVRAITAALDAEYAAKLAAGSKPARELTF
jgi:hypothetical protein